jgi:hypothetical protein
MVRRKANPGAHAKTTAGERHGRGKRTHDPDGERPLLRHGQGPERRLVHTAPLEVAGELHPVRVAGRAAQLDLDLAIGAGAAAVARGDSDLGEGTKEGTQEHVCVCEKEGKEEENESMG